ncbi:MAG TPA: hypothetical protein VN039_03330 [Nitrospira sp.]|nr:hypothetical protein [Nitrospira sp.]
MITQPKTQMKYVSGETLYEIYREHANLRVKDLPFWCNLKGEARDMWMRIAEELNSRR